MADTTHVKSPSAAARRPRRKASPAPSKSARKSTSTRGQAAAARQPNPQNSVARARAALGKAGAASKRTIDRLLKEWRRMDTSRKLQFTAALLGALAAAAAAPVVRSRMKKR